MNDTAATPEQQPSSPVANILNQALAVIRTPVAFYRAMPKSGGFGDPLVFVAAMGFIAGVLQALFGLLHIGVRLTVPLALGAVVYTPVLFVIGSFIGAAILFVIWKLTGSNESYETAYRCGAYASAIAPITAVLGLIPVAGALVEVGWMLFLLVTASVEVHKIAAKTAWIVFGAIAAILAVASISAQLAARRAAKGLEGWAREMNGKSVKDMTPEEAGKAASSFVKAMQEEAARKADEAKKAAESQSE